MANGVRFYDLSEQIAKAKHDFSTHAFYACLTNSQPNLSDTQLSQISQIASGNGYDTGGKVCTLVTVSETNGVTKVVLADPATWTATPGAMATFRYVVLYNYTQTGNPLVCYWDYGQALTLQVNEQFTVDLDNNGIITIGA